MTEEHQPGRKPAGFPYFRMLYCRMPDDCHERKSVTSLGHCYPSTYGWVRSAATFGANAADFEGRPVAKGSHERLATQIALSIILLT
ncbi:MAG: hypothetical protein OXG04_00435 [Acidobacteria bacterium]|nr:hypothetical protein [Acidobacteriota bacterium]